MQDGSRLRGVYDYEENQNGHSFRTRDRIWVPDPLRGGVVSPEVYTYSELKLETLRYPLYGERYGLSSSSFCSPPVCREICQCCIVMLRG